MSYDHPDIITIPAGLNSKPEYEFPVVNTAQIDAERAQQLAETPADDLARQSRLVHAAGDRIKARHSQQAAEPMYTEAASLALQAMLNARGLGPQDFETYPVQDQ